jgi:uncharacterized tellurite resistance protein B-like protein|tara:strand:+ start:1304 stop:1729 length:426 start_codon:yes stop_codon:yes gene_type:complete
MFKKIFSKKSKNNTIETNVLVAALLVHAAQIDERYTEVEKQIIKKALVKLYKINDKESEDLISKAEKIEQESNQIIEFTQEIKKNSMEFRIKVIEILWEIVYSDGANDSYESNLIRRVCGLLYVSDKDNGIIKTKVKNLIN